MTTVQKPIALLCLGQPATKPPWREKPSCFLLAEEDRQILPHTQRFMAERMNARVDVQNVDHSPNLTTPETAVTLTIVALTAPLGEIARTVRAQLVR